MRIRFRSNPNSTLGFIIPLLFELVFFVIGGAVLGYGGLQYLQGSAPQEVLVFIGVGAIFMAVSAVGMYHTWRRRQHVQHVGRLKEKYADEPWKVRPEWRDAELIEEGRLNWSTALFALGWNVFTWPLAAYILYTELQRSDPQWGVFFVLIFPLAGIGLAWMALSDVLRRRKFGATKLTMEDMPGRLGDSLRLRVQTGVKQNAAPDEGFHVRLSCYRRYVRYTRDSDGDSRREVEKDLLWRDEKKVRGRSYDTNQRLEVLVAFDLPTDQPPSTPEKREERIMWEVDIDADVPGLDFYTAFEIPVFEPKEPSPTSAEGQVDTPAVAESDAGSASPMRQFAEEATSESDDNPYEGYELGTDFTEPVSEGITMQTAPGGGLELHFAAGRNKGSALLFSVLAVATGVGGVFLITTSFFGALILFLFAGLTGYGAWTQWTTASTLVIEDGEISLVRGPFGRGTPTTFPCTDLADVSVTANGRAGSTTYYDLVLHRLDTASQQEVVESSEKAEQVAQFLQSSGLVAGPDAAATTERIKQNIRKQSTQLKVASGLSNKQEADWIAAKIKKAAQREAQFG